MSNRNIYRIYKIILFLFVTTSVTYFSQTNVVKNLKFQRVENNYVITYDLKGEENDEYNITLFFMRESDTLFIYRPYMLSGDFGEEVQAGPNKKIIWKFKEEIPNDIKGKQDFYFKISALKGQNSGTGLAFLKSIFIPGWGQISSGRGISWLYTIATLGAATYYVVNLGKHNDNVDIYNSAKEQYKISGSSEDYEKYTRAYDDMEKTYNTSNILLGAVIGIYAFNLLDALVFTSNEQNSNYVLKPQIGVDNNKQLIFGLTLGLKL